jgi:CubicO group peptidase (beta-lactamase class C family)
VILARSPPMGISTGAYLMNISGWRRIIAGIILLITLSSCTRSAETSTKTAIDYPAIQAALENSISESPPLDNVRAVLINDHGDHKVTLYRHNFTPTDYEHVFSVTKSVISTLIGIAISDGLIRDVEQPLSELLPQYDRIMKPPIAKVTLRQLMSMTGGFETDAPQEVIDRIWSTKGDLVAYILREGQGAPAGSEFRYSNLSAHLVAAVLATAIERADGSSARSVLDYAREKLFDPLEIDSRPAFDDVLDLAEPAFSQAGFGWGTDPRGINIGALGLRLRAPDMLKLGELYLSGGSWHGKQLLPATWISSSTTPGPMTPDYGLFWWVQTVNGHQFYSAVGAQGQRIAVAPDLGLVMVILSATNVQPELSDGAVSALVNQVISSIG